MDLHERELLESSLKQLHLIIGYDDAKKDFKKVEEKAMEELQANVVEQLERMKLDAEALQEKGIKFCVLHAEFAVNLATLALELLEDYAERWDEFQVDMLTAFADRVKNHYPHTASIRSTIDKELQAFIKWQSSGV